MRNPLDVVTSMFNFWASQTQNFSIDEQDFHTRYATAWHNLVKQEVTCWRDFHNFWISQAREGGIPVYFFRFEDIIKDAKPVLMDVFQFSLDGRPVERTKVEAKIDFLMRKKAEGAIKTQLYKPRDASSGNKNLHRFTEEQLAWIKSDLAQLLDFFDYNKGESAFFPDIVVPEDH